jgi:hypothetical protein
MRLNPAILGVIAALAGVAAGCGSSAGSSPTLASTTTKTTPPGTTSSTSTSGAGALQAEANAAAAGDIPDNQIFLVFRDPHAGYTMKYPEGWARQGSGDRVTFRDKNNIIRAVVSGGPVWTMSSVQADARTLKDARVRSQPRAITLSGRPAFKVVYRTVSAPNPVTGKRVTLSVDRYYLSKAHRRAVLDLGSPVGVDNVDAYRLISQSFRWS